MNKSTLAAALTGLVLAACATPATVGPTISADATRLEEQKQSEYVLEQRAKDARRIHDVAARILRANVAACPAKAPWLGAAFETVQDYGKDFQAAARTVYGAGDRPQPVWIAPDGPAARAGLQLTDVLVAVNGQPAPKGRRATSGTAKMIRKELDAGPVTLTVERGGTPMTLAIEREETCGYDVFVDDSSDVNAYATGRDLYVMRGMARFVESDDELALVISHELAHNTMNHVGKQARNRAVGALAGILIGAAAGADQQTMQQLGNLGGGLTGQAYSQEFETEADYVGMYYLAQAGYTLDTVETFWRRMATVDPKQIRMGFSHPSTASRFVGIQATREEIVDKKLAGEELSPNLKPN
jgi:hypothetical protein